MRKIIGSGDGSTGRIVLLMLVVVGTSIGSFASGVDILLAAGDRGITTVGPGAARGIDGARNRTALVIGNGAYEDAPLANPVNDARAVAGALSRLGFKVIERENQTMGQMVESIQEFGKMLRGGGVGLFYFSGHGAQVNGENYLIPVKSGITAEEHVRYKAVNLGEVLAEMEIAKNSMNIVILDACRNNPFKRSFRSSSSGLAQINAPAGTIIAYATSPGSVALDGDGKNGPYTLEFVRTIQVPGLKIEDVFKRVRKTLQEKTNNQQVPWESSSLVGDFYFTSASAAQQQQQPERQEPPPSRMVSADKSVTGPDGAEPAEQRYAGIRPSGRHSAPTAAMPHRTETPVAPATPAEPSSAGDISRKKLKLALFPPYILGGHGPDKARVHEAILKNLNEMLLYSLVRDEYSDDPGKAWSTGKVSSSIKPNLDYICARGRELGVDAVLLVIYEKDRTAASPKILSAEAYIVDVEKRKAYSHKVERDSEGIHIGRAMKRASTEYIRGRLAMSGN